jgi:hypothetical protein
MLKIHGVSFRAMRSRVPPGSFETRRLVPPTPRNLQVLEKWHESRANAKRNPKQNECDVDHSRGTGCGGNVAAQDEVD